MKTRFTTMLLTATMAFAQRIELGGSIGGGAFATSSGSSAGRGQVGAEACLFCSGRAALFAEYNHWYSAGAAPAFSFDRVMSADLAGAGLRIQGRRRVRVFFDVGAVAGRDEHSFGRGGALGGVVLGAGVEIPWGRHWYVRPQFRAYGLSPHSLEGLDAHWAVSGGAGAGYRF